MMTPQPRASVKKRGRALVTGGAIRLGRVIALALAEAGMDVAISYHRSARAARQTLADLRGYGVRACALRADLTDPRAAWRLVTEASRWLDGLDVLVNNAGVFARTPFATVTPGQYDRFLDVNLRAAFFCSQGAAAAMRRAGGHIVMIGDAGADRAWPGHVPYTVSKAGLVALTRGLAVALRRRGIAVNCVSPGAVLRPAGFPVARWTALTRGRAGRSDDVAAAVRFFATCPAYITGQVLRVDGGG
jgi:NAD(P)-dependent dehydrogenase (short-subunit alcohol dehydrogenase family)